MKKKNVYYIYAYIAAAYFLIVFFKLVNRELAVVQGEHTVFLMQIPEDPIYYFFGEIIIIGLIVINSLHLLFGDIGNSSSRAHTHFFVVEVFCATIMFLFTVWSVLFFDDFRDCFWYVHLANVCWVDSEERFIAVMDVISFSFKIVVGLVFGLFVCAFEDVKPEEKRPQRRFFYFEAFITYVLFFTLCVANLYMVRHSIIWVFAISGTIFLTFVNFLAFRRRARYDSDYFYRKPWGVQQHITESPQDKYASCFYFLSCTPPTFEKGSDDFHFLTSIEGASVLEGDTIKKEASLRMEGYARGYKEGYEDFQGLSRENISYMPRYDIKWEHLKELWNLRLLLWDAIVPGPQQDKCAALIESDGRGLGWGYRVYSTSYDKGYCEGYEALERARYGNLYYELRNMFSLNETTYSLAPWGYGDEISPEMVCLLIFILLIIFDTPSPSI